MELIDEAVLVVEDRVQKLIAEGSTEQIALKFIQRGIKADCGNAEACAIAVYLLEELNKELPPDSLIVVSVPGGVGMDYIEVFAGRRRDRRTVHFPETSPLGSFAELFDNAEWPELIMEAQDD